MPVHDRSSFENLYAGQPRWEIGRPQQAFLDTADKITGSVLDSGCGTGENALFFASRGQRVTGIDFLADPIQLARRKAAERGLTATFLVMDALALEELPEVFDNVIDSGLFHVFSDEDRRRYVDGLATVLKPQGRLFFLCFSDEEPGERAPARFAIVRSRSGKAIHSWSIGPSASDESLPTAWISVGLALSQNLLSPCVSCSDALHHPGRVPPEKCRIEAA